VLHITNGDSAVAALRASGIDGDLLPWRDALHEGPVPAGLDAAALRAERARHIAARGWAREDAVLGDMAARDARLQRAIDEGEEIGLWFETDLYDVLQLAQVVDRMPPGRAWLVLVGTGEFRGVAELTADELRAQPRVPVEARLAESLVVFWDAFRAPDPRALNDVDGHDVVAAAALRHRQQFPWAGDGLNRTERQLLQARLAGARTPVEAFLAQQRAEERPFLGDAIAFEYLAALPEADEAEAILAGRAEWTGRPDRWLGGVHLPAGAPAYRYDPATRCVV
jgi:hypothetical protein